MPHTTPEPQVIAFQGPRRIAAGTIDEVTPMVRAAHAEGAHSGRAGEAVLAFDARTSELVEIDLRDAGSDREVTTDQGETPPEAMVDSPPPTPADSHRGRGRPRLGVLAREVTLLPRHWDWLASQPGGASAAIRRLVEHARTANADRDRTRDAQESAYRFMSATLGDHPGFEEAIRALYAGDRNRFAILSEPWPVDLRDHARHLAESALPPS
jgi:uncharacterized protein